MKKKSIVIIPAAGMGSRMQCNINKQYILLNDKPILVHTLEKFENCELIDAIILVVKGDEIEYCKENIVNRYGFRKVLKIVDGGKERQDSVYNGINAIEECDVVLVHDGARPFIKDEIIEDSINGAIKYDACVVGVPLKDTVKVVDNDNNIINTPDRRFLWAVQTPQSFKYEIIKKAYDIAYENNISGTDDSMLVENLGIKVKMIMGDYNNIKITTKEDLNFAEAILK